MNQPSASLRRHWLCIAYAFPPINRSGTHRTLGFVRHLDALGWDSTVLTVEPDGEPCDLELLSRVPSSTTILRAAWQIAHCRLSIADCRLPIGSSLRPGAGPLREASRVPSPLRAFVPSCLRPFFSHLLKTPDSRTGWIMPAVRRGLLDIQRQGRSGTGALCPGRSARRRPEVIYSTSPYVSAHLIALALHAWTRIPWVADFRDPWRDSPFRSAARFRSLDRLDAWLERIVYRRASHVIFNTPTARLRACRRYPYLGTKAGTILNGFDGDLLAQVQPKRTAAADKVLLAHAGEFYGPRSPLPFFSALVQAIGHLPHLADRLEVLLLGPEHFNGTALRELADQAHVGRWIRVLGRKSHLETLNILAGCDILLLIGSSGEGSDLQIPNKLFEYLALHRPILAALVSTSPAVQILRQAQADAIIHEPDDSDGLSRSIVHLAQRRRMDATRTPPNSSSVAAFERSHRATELAAIFTRLTKHRFDQRRTLPPQKAADNSHG